MPGSPIGVSLRVGGVRERGMSGASVSRRGAPVDRRSHEWMVEANACPNLQQLRVLRGRKRLRFDAERLRRTPDESSVTDRIGCRQQHQLLRRLGQLGKTSQVVLLETVRQAARIGKREAAGELRSSQT